MYVNVRSREICCCSVMVADGVFDPPVICGSIFSLLTPNNRCSRPETGLATDAPNSVDAPVCPRLCGGATGARAASTGSEVGGLPDPSRETISVNCSGGSLPDSEQPLQPSGNRVSDGRAQQRGCAGLPQTLRRRYRGVRRKV